MVKLRHREVTPPFQRHPVSGSRVCAFTPLVNGEDSQEIRESGPWPEARDSDVIIWKYLSGLTVGLASVYQGASPSKGT